MLGEVEGAVRADVAADLTVDRMRGCGALDCVARTGLFVVRAGLTYLVRTDSEADRPGAKDGPGGEVRGALEMGPRGRRICLP